MPYAFPDAPQSIAIAQTCLLVYEIGKETVAGFDEFSLDNPHCLVSQKYSIKSSHGCSMFVNCYKPGFSGYSHCIW